MFQEWFILCDGDRPAHENYYIGKLSESPQIDRLLAVGALVKGRKRTSPSSELGKKRKEPIDVNV